MSGSCACGALYWKRAADLGREKERKKPRRNAAAFKTKQEQWQQQQRGEVQPKYLSLHEISAGMAEINANKLPLASLRMPRCHFCFHPGGINALIVREKVCVREG